jgi:protein TonB
MRDDEEAAGILADVFYRAGFMTAGGSARQDELDECAVALVCWSGASQRSTQMREAADRAAQSGKAMTARLDGHPLPPSLWRLPAFDLSQWSFAPEDPVLDGLYAGVERAVTRARDATARLGRIPSALDQSPAPRGQTVNESDLEAEAGFWRRIQTSNDPADFLSYLDRFGPKGAFAELALLRIERLGGAKPQAAPSRAQPKPEPATPAAPAWTGWSVQPGTVRPPRFLDNAPDAIDVRLDRRQPDARRPSDPAPRRPEQPRAEPPRAEHQRPDYYARDYDPEPPRRSEPPAWREPQTPDPRPPDARRPDLGRFDQGRSEPDDHTPPSRPAPPCLDPVQPDARRAEPRRYLTPAAGDEPYRALPPRRPSYDQDEAHTDPLPPTVQNHSSERRQGGSRGIMAIFVAIVIIAGAGYALRGGLPSSGVSEETSSSASDSALASTTRSGSDSAVLNERSTEGAAPSAVVESPDSALTPPPRGDSFTLDSIGVTEAPASSRGGARARLLASAGARAAAQPRQERWSPVPIAPDPNAAYVPPPLASLPAAEPPAIVQPAPVGAVTPVPPTTSPAVADAPVRAAAKVRWQTRPSASRLDQVYPSRARQGDVEGVVALRCTILPDLRTACSVLSETPSGYGFGAAALRAAESMRASPALDDGSSATGAVADVAIRFTVQ